MGKLILLCAAILVNAVLYVGTYGNATKAPAPVQANLVSISQKINPDINNDLLHADLLHECRGCTSVKAYETGNAYSDNDRNSKQLYSIKRYNKSSYPHQVCASITFAEWNSESPNPPIESIN